MASRNLLVFLPFGEPHCEEKIRILRSNLATIGKGPWTRTVVRLAVYSKDLCLPDDITRQVEIIHRPGIVGDFIRELVTPHVLQAEGHDYLILLLDDVEILTQPDWTRLLVIKELSGAHLLSPTLSHDSAKIVYDYTKHVINAPYTARLTTVMEFFCFLFDCKSYTERYYPLLDDKNPWMWGIDLCLYYHGGVRPAQVNGWVIKHHYAGESYGGCGRDPQQDMVAYLGEREETVQSLWEKRYVISTVNMNHLTAREWEAIWSRLLTPVYEQGAGV